MEARVCLGLVLSALRRGDGAAVGKALDDFGGLPPKWMLAEESEGPSLLWRASEPREEDPSASGFGALLDARAAQDQVPSEPEVLGAWLRAGLPTAREGVSGLDGPRLMSRAAQGMWRFGSVAESEGVVGACFARDNPVALARIMSRPAMLEALLKTEPVGTMGSEGQGAAADGWAWQNGSAIESTLLWQAVKVGALRCAALLASTPGFDLALDPRTLRFGGLKGPEGGSFFEIVAGALRADLNPGERARSSQAWEGLVEACVLAAARGALASSQGAADWPQALCKAEAPGLARDATRPRGDAGPLGPAETLNRLGRLLDQFVDAGLEVDWAKALCELPEGSAARDYLALRFDTPQAQKGAPAPRL
jgi:hypothetical protein